MALSGLSLMTITGRDGRLVLRGAGRRRPPGPPSMMDPDAVNCRSGDEVSAIVENHVRPRIIRPDTFALCCSDLPSSRRPNTAKRPAAQHRDHVVLRVDL
jgi:hypothetical protein